MWAAPPMLPKRAPPTVEIDQSTKELHMQKYLRALCAIAIGALTVTAAAVASFGETHSGLGIARAATVQYRDLPAAKAAGYSLLKDKNGVACIAMDSMPEMGAMGIHYANPRLVGDGALDLREPEALVYQPVAGGGRRLAAIEYVVLKSAWDAKHEFAPIMFGQHFNVTPAGNRFGLPAYYSLHVWLYKHNPSGEYSMWNPLVHCGGSR
jgi:hypothetical protein